MILEGNNGGGVSLIKAGVDLLHLFLSDHSWEVGFKGRSRGLLLDIKSYQILSRRYLPE